MLFKKFFCMVTILSIISVSLSGCSFGGSGEKNGKPVTSVNVTKPLKYKINVLEAEKHGQDAAYKYITEKFNVEFEFIPVSFDDWATKTRIWVVGGDMPDIMWYDLQQSNYREFLGWKEHEVIRPMPKFGDKYPNLQKLADELKSDEYFTLDGDLYAWPAYQFNEITNGKSLAGFYYRRDWAEKLGLAKEGDEYSWDEFVNLSKAFVQQDPGGNGPGKTLGIGGPQFALPGAIGVMQYSPNWDTYLIKDGKYVWGMGQPETLEGLKEAQRLYNEGAIWNDYLLAKSNDATNKFLTGEMGILYGGGWNVSTVTNLRNNVLKSNPNIDPVKAVVPMLVKNPEGKLLTQVGLDYWCVTVFNAKMDDEKMERIMAIYDWIASDEGYEYATKGVKGIDWDDKDGIITIQPEDRNKANHILKNIVRGNSKFDFEDPRMPKTSIDTVLRVAKRLDQDDVYTRRLDMEALYFSAPNKDKYGVFYDEGREKMIQLIYTSKDIEKDWNDWLNSMRTKVTAVEDEFNNILLK